MGGGSKTPDRHEAETHKKNIFEAIDPKMGYLQFLYYDPVSSSSKPFPKGTTINIIYVDKTKKETHHSTPLIIDNSEGKIKFTIEQRTNLYFEIEFKELTFVNLTKNSLLPLSEFSKQIQDKKYEPGKDMTFKLPQKMTLANSFWEIPDVPVYDKNSRIFKDLENNRLSSGSGYLPVTLKPEWQYIAFKYYDCAKRDWYYVPPNLGIYGYNLDVSVNDPVTVSTVWKSKFICLPWIEEKNGRKIRNPNRVMLKFNASNAFVKSGGTLVADTISNIRSKPLMERFKYYDLPEEWRSTNWKASLTPYGNLIPIEKLINEETSESKPIVFDLDSIVLTDSSLKCEFWNSNNHFTVFDIRMDVANSDTNKPYWTSGKLNTNFFSRDITGDFVRVIGVNGIFYDVTDKRSKSGTVIGARAAVRNDADVHHGQSCVEPIKGAGNFELHYFKDCLDYTSPNVYVIGQEKPANALMIYWSCRFTGASGDIVNFQKEGMLNTRIRWECKNYRFRPTGSSDIVVKPFFFYEGRESQPFKCTVIIHKKRDRDDMDITIANFQADNYQPSKDTEVDVDGLTFKSFTMSHELGHAMGLDDEYLEPIPAPSEDADVWNPTLTKFSPDQYYPGMPYSCDPVTMMVSNYASRLRHLWYFCRRLNETEEIKKLTGNPTFQVSYNAGKKSYKYYLKEDVKEFYKPAYKQENVKNGDSGVFDLFLYKIGDDESCDYIIPGVTGIDSILIIRHKVCWKFKGSWTDNVQKVNYLSSFQTDIDNSFKLKYPHDRPSDSDFKKVYFYFVPHYRFESTTSLAHFEITVSTDVDLDKDPEFFGDGFKSSKFNVNQTQNSISIYRYMLGLKPYKTETVGGATKKVSVNKIDGSELEFLMGWISNQRGK